MATAPIELPQRDQVWQHYKGAKYLIIGLAHDEDGLPQVVYTDNAEPPGPVLYCSGLSRFLQTVDTPVPDANGGAIWVRKVSRFTKTGERRIERRVVDASRIGVVP